MKRKVIPQELLNIEFIKSLISRNNMKVLADNISDQSFRDMAAIVYPSMRNMGIEAVIEEVIDKTILNHLNPIKILSSQTQDGITVSLKVKKLSDPAIYCDIYMGETLLYDVEILKLVEDIYRNTPTGGLSVDCAPIEQPACSFDSFTVERFNGTIVMRCRVLVADTESGEPLAKNIAVALSENYEFIAESLEKLRPLKEVLPVRYDYTRKSFVEYR